MWKKLKLFRRRNQASILELFKIIQELPSEIGELKSEIFILKPRLKDSSTQTELQEAKLQTTQEVRIQVHFQDLVNLPKE